MDPELKKELKDIKTLLALIACLEGATSKQVAHVLGVTSRTIQKMLPLKSLKENSKED